MNILSARISDDGTEVEMFGGRMPVSDVPPISKPMTGRQSIWV